MKLTIDSGLCSGHGRCYSMAPDVYEPDDEGFADHRDVAREVPFGHETSAREGARSCPEGAIEIAED